MTAVLNIRNVGILAHVDAGKTTITEHMLYESGRIRTLGSVDRGTAHTDFMDVERERGISVRSASVSFIWKGVNINLIDTPGHADFSAEVERSLRVLDCAVMVISAVEGVQAQTEVLWKALRAMDIPTVIFINKIDRVGSDVSRVVEEVRRALTPGAVPVQIMFGEGTQEPDVLSVLENESTQDKVNEALDRIIECLADRDEQILQKYISEDRITVSELDERLAVHTKAGRIFPVLYGSAIKGVGINHLLDSVIHYLPGPSGNVEGPLSGVVFKIDYDDTIGKTAHVRLYNGSVRTRDMVLNVSKKVEEKVTRIRKINIQKYEEAGEAHVGEIAAICGLNSARLGDIIGSEDGVKPGYHLSVPFLKVQAFPFSEPQYPRLVEALQILTEEDPMLDMEWLQAEREVHLKIMGAIQMEILTSILKNRFGLDVTFGKASVIYKETPSRPGEGFVSYTMPKPCWAVLKFKIEPGERGSGVKYSSTVRTEYILERYQKQVEKTIPKALEQGLYGWEVTDIKITLIDGEYHVMHTHPPDFAVATPMGIMDGLDNTGTNLLEPILKFNISAPEELGGRILNDIVQMRGNFDSPVMMDGTFYVEGLVPAATSLDYHIKLASMTGGRGTMSADFTCYRECPLELGAVCQRKGANPLDRSKYILYARNALAAE